MGVGSSYITARLYDHLGDEEKAITIRARWGSSMFLRLEVW
jgi:hypothetical protein